MSSERTVSVECRRQIFRGENEQAINSLHIDAALRDMWSVSNEILKGFSILLQVKSNQYRRATLNFTFTVFELLDGNNFTIFLQSEARL